MKENTKKDHEDLLDCHDEMTSLAARLKAFLRSQGRSLAYEKADLETQSEILSLIEASEENIETSLRGLDEYIQVIQTMDDSDDKFVARRCLTIFDEVRKTYEKIQQGLFHKQFILAQEPLAVSNLNEAIDHSLDLIGRLESRFEQINSIRSLL